VLGHLYSKDVIDILNKLYSVVTEKKFLKIKKKFYKYKKNLLNSVFLLERSGIINLSQKDKIIAIVKELKIKFEFLNYNKNLNKKEISGVIQQARKLLFQLTLIELDLFLFAYLKKKA